MREGTFEDDHGLRQVTPEEYQDAELLLGSDRAVEMPGRLGDLYRFLAAGNPFGKIPRVLRRRCLTNHGSAQSS